MKSWPPAFAAGCLEIVFTLPLAAGRAQSPAAAAADSPAAASPAPSDSPAAADSTTPAPTPDDLTKFKTADELWAHIQELQNPSAPPQTQDEALALFHNISAAAASFQAQYPKDAHYWEAKLLAIQVDSAMDSAKAGQPDLKKLATALQAVADAKDAPKDIKAQARITLIQVHASSTQDGDPFSPAMEKEILAFIHDFPLDPNVAQLQMLRYQALEKTDKAKASKLLDTFLKDPNPDVVKIAQAQARVRDLEKKPLELKFTATDGTAVDVSKLRGKVVLVDFWASWCGPCMNAMPDLVKSYNDLHKKGFEIVGISLDQDKERMTDTTKVTGMPWPQYFDGKGWDNEISSSYGIMAIPRMFLVNKKGMVVDPDVQEPPRDEIEKLMAE